MNVNTFSFHGLQVNPKTNWSFIRVELADGSVGWGECSLNGWETMQAAFVEMLRPQIVGRRIHKARDVGKLCESFLHTPGGLVVHSVKSATEQALIDALARASERSVSAFLSESLNAPINRASVDVYANINRGTKPRTPIGFAGYAKKAVSLGFRSVKLAPFDGVLPSNCDSPDAKPLIEEGIARIFAVRAAIGADVGLKVDCHWRFTPPVARLVLERLREARLDWFECPVSERFSMYPEILALRKRANAMGVALAGAEMFTGVEGFRPLLEAGLYDTIMPDVKYCGGLIALQEIARLATKYGVKTVPHNPSGPICNLASLHACALGTGCDLLEYQLGESDLYRQVVFGAHPSMVDGAFVVPTEPGLGATVDQFTLAEHPMQPVQDALHPSLG